MDAFWLATIEQQNVYKSAINEQIRKTAIEEKMHQDAMNNIAATCQKEQLLLNHQAEKAHREEQVDHADHVRVIARRVALSKLVLNSPLTDCH